MENVSNLTCSFGHLLHMTVMTYAFMECFQNCRLSECMCVNILRIKWIVPQWYFRLWSFCLWHTCNMDTCIAIYIISLQFYLIFITKYSIIILSFYASPLKLFGMIVHYALLRCYMHMYITVRTEKNLENCNIFWHPNADITFS